MPENHFDEAIAATYDVFVADMYESATLDATIALLGELADGRAAIEFGVAGMGARARTATDKAILELRSAAGDFA